jgi:hypothetical protein
MQGEPCGYGGTVHSGRAVGRASRSSKRKGEKDGGAEGEPRAKLDGKGADVPKHRRRHVQPLAVTQRAPTLLAPEIPAVPDTRPPLVSGEEIRHVEIAHAIVRASHRQYPPAGQNADIAMQLPKEKCGEVPSHVLSPFRLCQR